MEILVFSIIPIFSIITIGCLLKNYIFKSTDFWNNLDKLTYYLLMPSMLVYKISQAKIDGTFDAFASTGLIVLILLIFTVICILLNFALKLKGSTFTSFYQGCIRFNSYMYLAIIERFLDAPGIAIAAFLMTFTIPIINILSISIFGVYANQKRFSFFTALKQISFNPLILACILGGIINIFSIELYFISNVLFLLGSTAITIGLISIGAGLKFNLNQIKNITLYLSSFIKLLLFPILSFALCRALNLPDIFVISCVLFAAMPTATSSYILAGQLGGDKNLMSVIITFQTIICFFSIWGIMNLLNKYIA